MDRVLEDFITTLRRSGVRISVSESLDAARALQLVGYDDRNLLENSLSVALAKSAQEKEIFSIVSTVSSLSISFRSSPSTKGRAKNRPKDCRTSPGCS